MTLVAAAGCATMQDAVDRRLASVSGAPPEGTELIRCAGNRDEEGRPVKPLDSLSLRTRTQNGKTDYFLDVRYAYPGHDRSVLEITRLEKVVAADEFTEDLNADVYRGVYTSPDGTKDNPVELTVRRISKRDPAGESPVVTNRVTVVDVNDKVFPGFHPRFNQTCEMLGDFPR